MNRNEQIRQLRKDAGLSIHQAASMCRVADRTWTRWESGDRRMPDGAAELFCSKVGVRYDDVFSTT